MIFLRAETKMKLKYNICDDITAKEECNVQYKIEKYSLIIILSSAFFWAADF